MEVDASSSNTRYPDGSITRIVYHNFLTYDHVECKPGPNLNVIIGTNGAGKSSVICGICLAVGGNPRILGRSERLGDYIKHKREEGFVELTIADSQKGDQIIKILLQRPSNCLFFINDERSTQRAVRDLVASYNIQIDNPCTFLAQDKVKSFSEQSPVDLLRNTERAGNPALLAQHEELIKKKDSESVHLEKAREVQQRLQSVEGEIAMLLPRVENYKKKEFLRTKIRVLQKKKAMLDYKEAEERFSIQEAAVDQLQSILQESGKKIEELRKKTEEDSKHEKDYTNRCNEAMRQISSLRDYIGSLSVQYSYSAKVYDAKQRFKRLKTQSDGWEQEMDSLKKQVDHIKENVCAAKKELEGYEEFKKEATRKAQQFIDRDDKLCRMEDELQTEEGELLSNKNKLREEEKRLDRLIEGRIRVLESMRSNMADEAWRWYEANRSRFRHPVHVPILHVKWNLQLCKWPFSGDTDSERKYQLLYSTLRVKNHEKLLRTLKMTVQDIKSATLLENLIAVRDLPMFIFGCKEDETILTDRKHNWKLNSTVIPPSQVDIRQFQTEVTAEMKAFGFTRFAVDLFSGPDVVKYYLCNVARLHQVPIGSARTNDLYDAVKSAFVKTPYKLYLTDKYRVQFTVSKYGSHEVVGQQNELRSPARLLVAHTSSVEEKSSIEAAKQQNRNREMELIERRAQLNNQRSCLHRDKEELKAQQVRRSIQIDLPCEDARLDGQHNLLGELEYHSLKSMFNSLTVPYSNSRDSIITKISAVWRTRRDELINLERSLSNRESKLERLSSNRPDMNQARAALTETMILASREVHEGSSKMLSKLEKLRGICVEEALLRVTLESLRERLSEFDEKLQELREKQSEDKALLEGKVAMFRTAKEELNRAMDHLYEICGMKTLEESKMTANEKNIMKMLNKLFIDENIPNDKADVLRLMEEEKAKLNIASADGSKEDVERCDRLKVEKATLLERKEHHEVTREVWKANMLKKVMEWREPVEQLICKINANYGKYFATLGCVGEVYLEVPEDPLNIGGYGIMIMVSFRRGERLRRLDHQVQSGGERSVSTMLYLLALQELCPVPFRCVDEINQGMDPVNERKIFDIMVDTLSGDGNLAKTQYFLLTPKLLHGLKFSRKVTVQIVHNGATLSENCHEWDMRNFLSLMRSHSN